MHPITTRPYQTQDAAATIDVFLRAVREIAAKDYSPAQIAAWAQVPDAEAWGQRRLTQPTWVAIQNHQVIGFTDLTEEGCIDMLFVHAEYQSQGVATQLLACVEEAAHSLGMDRIHTQASLTARRFFEGHGFVVLTKQIVTQRGQTFTNFVMEKWLSK